MSQSRLSCTPNKLCKLSAIQWQSSKLIVSSSSQMEHWMSRNSWPLSLEREICQKARLIIMQDHKYALISWSTWTYSKRHAKPSVFFKSRNRSRLVTCIPPRSPFLRQLLELLTTSNMRRTYFVRFWIYFRISKLLLYLKSILSRILIVLLYTSRNSRSTQVDSLLLHLSHPIRKIDCRSNLAYQIQ